MAAKPTSLAVEKVLTNMSEKIATLGRATDAATVLVAAETLSQELAGLLESKMPNLTSKSKKKLFRGYGPVATFSARTEMAYVFGFIDKELFDDINILRGIRNDFAHATTSIHLESPEIVDQVRKWTGLKTGNGRVQFFHKSLQISRRVKLLIPATPATKTRPS